MKQIRIEDAKDNSASGVPFEFKAEVRRGFSLGNGAFGLRVDLGSKTLWLTLEEQKVLKAQGGEMPLKYSYLLRIKEYRGTDLKPADYS